MSGELGIAIIGCGGIAEKHRIAFQILKDRGLEGFRISATCDPLRDRAARLAEEVAKVQSGPKPLVYAEHRRMLDQNVAEVADICTSPDSHHGIAVDCLNAGWHVTVEKPFAISVRAGRLMCETAERTGKLLSVSERARYIESARYDKWVLDQGYIGSLQMIAYGHMGSNVWGPDKITAGTPWRHSKLKAGAGAALDTSSHAFHVLRYLAGEIEEVGAVAGYFEPVRTSRDEMGTIVARAQNDVEDQVLAVLKFANGAIGVYGDGWGGHGEPCSFGSRFLGSKGSLQRGEIIWDDGKRANGPELFRFHAPRELKDRFFPLGLIESSVEEYDFALELHDFLKAIAEGGQPETSGREGLKDIAVCYSVIESAQIGQFVRVADVLSSRIEEYQQEINDHFGL